MGLDTHSTLVILSKTAKFGVCLHKDYFQGLLLHEFVLETSFMMESALIWMKRWKSIVQPRLSGEGRAVDLLAKTDQAQGKKEQEESRPGTEPCSSLCHECS